MTKSKTSRLQSHGHAATAALESALEAHRQFAESACDLVEELEQDAAAQEGRLIGDSGLHSMDLLGWLCTDISADHVDWHSGLVGTAGSGPWPIDDFDSFLDALGFKLANLPNPEVSCVVLGTDDWSEADLAEQVFDRHGSELIVLSQPLFIAGVLRNVNPMVAMERSALLAIAETHPALSHLIDRGFDWIFDEQSTRVTIWETTRELAEKSPLRLAGYSVAVTTGPSESERKRILKRFFLDPAPEGVVTPTDRKRWGPAKSAQRLYGMATFLAWLCRYQGTNAPQAVERWKDDLSWLRREFFRPIMQFEWPAPTEPRKREPGSWNTTPNTPKTTLNPAAAWPFPSGQQR